MNWKALLYAILIILGIVTFIMGLATLAMYSPILCIITIFFIMVWFVYWGIKDSV